MPMVYTSVVSRVYHSYTYFQSERIRLKLLFFCKTVVEWVIYGTCDHIRDHMMEYTYDFQIWQYDLLPCQWISHRKQNHHKWLRWNLKEILCRKQKVMVDNAHLTISSASAFGYSKCVCMCLCARRWHWYDWNL